jgi:DNA-binding transcriptional ArsR family regulator
MGATKTSHFDDNQNDIAIIAKALGHPARIAIVEHLAKINACVCGKIAEVLPLAQPTVSQHLKELKTAGIIRGEVEGNSICYCIDNNRIKLFRDYFSEILKQIENHKCVLENK